MALFDRPARTPASPAARLLLDSDRVCCATNSSFPRAVNRQMPAAGNPIAHRVRAVQTALCLAALGSLAQHASRARGHSFDRARPIAWRRRPIRCGPAYATSLLNFARCYQNGHFAHKLQHYRANKAHFFSLFYRPGAQQLSGRARTPFAPSMTTVRMHRTQAKAGGPLLNCIFSHKLIRRHLEYARRMLHPRAGDGAQTTAGLL